MYRKVRQRGAFDFAMVGAAIMVAMADGKVRTARVVLSGVAPAPWRSTEAEEALVGKSLDAVAAAEAAAAAVKDAIPLPQNEYKVSLVQGMLEETLVPLAA